MSKSEKEGKKMKTYTKQNNSACVRKLRTRDKNSRQRERKREMVSVMLEASEHSLNNEALTIFLSLFNPWQDIK